MRGRRDSSQRTTTMMSGRDQDRTTRATPRRTSLRSRDSTAPLTRSCSAGPFMDVPEITSARESGIVPSADLSSSARMASWTVSGVSVGGTEGTDDMLEGAARTEAR